MEVIKGKVINTWAMPGESASYTIEKYRALLYQASETA
jgi:hypothetical protein